MQAEWFAFSALTSWRIGTEAMTFSSRNICVFCGCGNVNSGRRLENGRACRQLYPLVQIEFGCCICLSVLLFLFQPRLLYETNWIFFPCVGSGMFPCDCSLPSSCFRRWKHDFSDFACEQLIVYWCFLFEWDVCLRIGVKCGLQTV